ncbi:MAG: 6-bladed beta-propeller, partial [Calditrichia bacterium]
ENVKRKSKLNDQIFRFIFGRKELEMVKPINLLVTQTGSLIVLDQGNQRVIAMDIETGKLKELKSLVDNSFPSLVGICQLGEDEILFTDSRVSRIFIQKLSDSPEIFNDTLILNQPTGIAYSRTTKQIWLAETSNHRLLVLDRSGRVVKHVGQRGTQNGEFNFPTFIWIDEEGIVYIVDTMNFRVQLFTPEGEFLSAFGKPGDATGYFARPKGIATDSFGHIYVVDALFHSVQVFDRDGNFLYHFGIQGKGKGEFWLPTGIFIDPNNHIYIADSYNARVQVFQLIPGEVNEK